MTPASKPGRGRPKGTGLNDAAQLRAIASLMVADPDLRPTTAIKTLGITDPSVIRRLRDKFHAAEAQLVAELRGPTRGETREPMLPFMVAEAPTASIATGVVRAVPLSHALDVRKTAPVVSVMSASPTGANATVAERPDAARPVPQAPARDAHTAPAQTSVSSELPSWIGVGLSMYAFGVGTQVALLNTMFPWLPMAAAVQSHVALTQYALAMGRQPTSNPGIRPTG